MDSSRVLVMEAGNVKEFDRFGHIFFLFVVVETFQYTLQQCRPKDHSTFCHNFLFFEDHFDKNHLTINENNHMTIIILT